MPIWVGLVTQSLSTTRIDTVWPTSVAGWVALALGAFAVIGYGVTAWKSSNRPILTKIEEAKSYFVTELARVEKDFSSKLAAQQNHMDGSLDDYHGTVTGEINGWAKRFTDDHADITRHELALGDLAGKLIESRADRDNLNRRVNEISVKVDENTRETRELERTMVKALQDSERRILDAISGRPRRTDTK